MAVRQRKYFDSVDKKLEYVAFWNVVIFLPSENQKKSGLV